MDCYSPSPIISIHVVDVLVCDLRFLLLISTMRHLSFGRFGAMLIFLSGFLMTLRPGYILQDFGGEDASCLSHQEDFGKLRSGEEEASLEVGLKSWCIVKLE